MTRRYWISVSILLVCLMLTTVACGRSAQSEPTLAPTSAALSGTAADASTQTAQSFTVPSPTSTHTPSPTPSATATATPTVTPTPLPSVLIERAQAALHNGDVGSARQIFEELSPEALDAVEAAQTRFGLIQSLLEGGNHAEAASAAREFLDEYPDHMLVPAVSFVLAEALMGAGEYLAAVDAYRAYLLDSDLLVPYVQMWIGDAYTLVGAYEDAIDAFDVALAHAPTRDLILQIREKMGLAYNYAGNYSDALAQYDAILAIANDENQKARIQYQAARTHLAANQPQAAYSRFRDLVENYYKTPAAYDALVDLLNSGQPVDDFQRGLVDYYNDAQDAAIAAFYRAIEADLDGHPGVLHYYAALAYRSTGNYAGALMEFEKLINTHPGDPYLDDTLLAMAWTQYLVGDSESAVATYRDFVSDNPFNQLAPEALWWAANIRFWLDDYEAAEPLFTQLVADYPANEHAADALYRAGFCRFREARYIKAEEAWQRYVDDYSTGELVAGAHYWRGRAFLAAGEAISATAALEQAVEAGPLDYYSQRALDYLFGIDSGASPTAQGDVTQELEFLARQPFLSRDFELESDQTLVLERVERAAADGWLAGWMGLSHTEAVTVSELSATLAADPRLLRGQELWQLGRRAEAKAELEWLRVDTVHDAAAQYQLAIFFRDLGLYRSSILAANAAIRISPARSPFDAPPFLAKLAYPVYYGDLVLPEAMANDLDPLVVFALVHQESLFEGFATSFAFAHGLMQIIPATGRSIANSLGWAGYETEDLYRPFISVKFGTWYLAQQRDTFEGQLYPALAAYNAGPANAQRWLERALDACDAENQGEECSLDPDLFVEIIDIFETRLYIRQIYKHYAIYQHLYGSD